jgi:elongation factor G
VAKLKETKTGDTLCDDGNKIRYACAAPMPTLISFALESKATGDEDKIYISLTKLLEEDTALKLERNAETKEILLSGLGQVHIESTIEKLKRKYNVEVLLNTPKIPIGKRLKRRSAFRGNIRSNRVGMANTATAGLSWSPSPAVLGLNSWMPSSVG